MNSVLHRISLYALLAWCKDTTVMLASNKLVFRHRPTLLVKPWTQNGSNLTWKFHMYDFSLTYASRKHAPYKNYGNEKVWNTGHGETKHKK
jgi:hypothetical protein